MDPVLSAKIERLRRRLASLGSVVVAYSGGSDSTLLLRVAVGVLGDRALGVIAVSPSIAGEEVREAVEVARGFGARVREVVSREGEDPDYIRNAPDRCFHCKKELAHLLRAEAEREESRWIAYGAIHDDLGDYRPGMDAAARGGMIAPLLDEGFTKEDVREASRALGLPTWDKPASACLASRIPYGSPVTPEKLRQIGEAERALRGLGFRVVRVRHFGERARVEVGADEVVRLAAGSPLRGAAEDAVRAAGFREVEFDPRGYRAGSLNEGLAIR